ncbi:putative ribonuclease H-like domain-containing protein [Tanacetum coccineum]
MALLSMRARKFYRRTGRKITIDGSDTTGYDKSKVKCFNCHKMRHFARECRGPKNQDNMNRSDEEAPTNIAFIAFSNSEVLNDKTCSKSCLKNYETLKNQYDSLRIELNKCESDLANYKRCLASLEEQLVFYKKNEVAFCDQIDLLKKDASFKDSKINALKIQVENLKKEKESIKIKVDGFENTSKSLDTLVRSLKEFQQPKFLGYGVNVNESVTEMSSNETKKTTSAPIIKDWEFDSDEDEPEISHLIKDCNFHDKRMAQKPVLNKENKGTGQREVKPVWNSVMRTNHQNFSKSRRNFMPTTVMTKTGPVQISTARPSSSRTAVPVSTGRPINTAFNSARTNFVNTGKGKSVSSAVRKVRDNAVKSSACWTWRSNGNIVDHVSKDSGSYICKHFNYVDPTGRLKYALTHNPTINDSLVKQFWQTITVRTLANGNQQIIASIDNKEYIVTEASIRSKLQLADATGINNLPDAEIYEGLTTLGRTCTIAAYNVKRFSTRSRTRINNPSCIPTPLDPIPSTSQPPITTTTELPQPPSPSRSPHRQEPKIPQSQGPTPTIISDEETTGVEVDTRGATTTTFGLDAWLDSGNLNKSPLRSHEIPLQEGHPFRSVEDKMTLEELMVLVLKLETKVTNLEKELKETKQTLGGAIITLVNKVKTLEVALKRKTKKVVVSDFKDEETEAQGRKI